MSNVPGYGSGTADVLKLRRSAGFQNVLNEMRRDDEDLDVVFLVAEERFPAHRAWVSANSPKLRTMLKKRTREAFIQEVNLDNVRAGVWRMAMDYIYFEEVFVSSTTEKLELLECAGLYQLQSLEEALLKSLISRLSISNCCQVFAGAHRLKCDGLKKKAFQFIEDNFFRLRLSKTLVMLDANLMEEVVSCRNLKFHNDLDLLKCIIRWLMVHGHQVEDWLSASILSDGEDENDLESTRETTDQVLNGEVIERITKHVSISQLGTSDLLREAARLSKGAKLTYLVESCVQAFYNPDWALPLRKKIPVFSVAHQFYGVYKWDVGLSVDSPWKQDALGLWNWLFHVEVRKEESVDFVGCYLALKPCELGNEYKGYEASFQIFVRNPRGAKFFVSKVKCTRKLTQLQETSFGLNNLISFTDLKSYISEDNGSSVFGATISISSST